MQLELELALVVVVERVQWHHGSTPAQALRRCGPCKASSALLSPRWNLDMSLYCD